MSRQIGRWQRRYPRVADRLCAARVRAGLSQHDVAFDLHISQPAYWLIERGISRPAEDRLVMLAVVLQLDPHELAVLAGYAQPGG